MPFHVPAHRDQAEVFVERHGEVAPEFDPSDARQKSPFGGGTGPAALPANNVDVPAPSRLVPLAPQT